MVQINFIILHYKDYDVTKRSVDSILDLKEYLDTKIVIVDNASNNQSGEQLERTYAQREDVEVLFVQEANGFSYANNLGYQHCKKHFEPDIYVISNNDIVFDQPEFLVELRNVYIEKYFDICGPDIVDYQKRYHCNPLVNHIISLEEATRYKQETEQKLRHPQIAFLKEKMRENFADFKRSMNNVLKIKPQNPRARYYQEDVCLWGACLIFSKSFAEKKDLPFFPETYFYHEEQILFYQAKKLGMKVIYDPRIRILHEQGVATKLRFGNELAKRKFQWKNNLSGTQVYIDMLKQEK